MQKLFHSKFVIALIVLVILLSSYATLHLLFGVRGTYYLFGDTSQNQTLQFPLISPLIFKGECTDINGTPTAYSIKNRMLTFQGSNYIIYKKYLIWDQAVLKGEIPAGDHFDSVFSEDSITKGIYNLSEDGAIRLENDSGEYTGTYRREGEFVYVQWESQKELPYFVFLNEKVMYITYGK
ncbi:MAG: hypothetical protein ACYCYM_10090 [Saccharofermentanales bacterium]